ncbi:MAG TPA: hypothetical protein VFK03_03725 [Candidatus Saccharimonadales bacterium]|nr:hypothetical protein [Candidatus Saccharimonadales bacterium]
MVLLKQIVTIKRISLAWLVGLVLSLSLAQAVAAVTTISQGYTADKGLVVGSIVALKQNTTDHVVAANRDNVDALFGVIINDGTSLISLSSGSNQQVQVATSGTVPVLVSDLNGDIKQGDQITASAIDGVGMRANRNTKVIGIAQGAPVFSDGSQQTYKDSSGNEHKTKIGQVPVEISVSYYFKEPDHSIIPAAFQNIANSVAGKPVNPLPIILGGAIFIIMLIVVASIIYSMIRSSIISVGRNPMSQSAVYRDVIQLSALVLGILGVGLAAIYLVLTKL